MATTTPAEPVVETIEEVVEPATETPVEPVVSTVETAIETEKPYNNPPYS